jgi:hypothetical protein
MLEASRLLQAIELELRLVHDVVVVVLDTYEVDLLTRQTYMYDAL